MLEVNQQNIKKMKDFSVFTVPRKMNFAGFKTLIPNKFISKKGFVILINLPDSQKLKLKKGDEIVIVTIGDLKSNKHIRKC